MLKPKLTFTTIKPIESSAIKSGEQNLDKIVICCFYDKFHLGEAQRFGNARARQEDLL